MSSRIGAGRSAWMVVCCLWSVVAIGCGGDDAAPAECAADTIVACVCEDTGAIGERLCVDGSFGACECRRQQPGEVCVDDLDCQDGRFCNGVERCEPESDDANESGCVAAIVMPICDDDVACTLDVCSDDSDRCEFTPPDADGDGHADATCRDAEGDALGDDCDDADAERFPGNPELCDAAPTHDEDCDSSTIGDRDLDGDGATDVACCNPRVGGGMDCGTDCDDATLARNPDQVEFCDQVDNDCDETIDEDAIDVAWYDDQDGDGFGAPSDDPVLSCELQAGRSLRDTDCNDDDGALSPSAVEVCDGVDNDCDETVDERVCESVCGDGIATGSEVCDDGNRLNGDGCSRGCTVEHGFQCLRDTACAPICGDGIRLARFEACDDGNTDDGDYCAGDCSQGTGYCGDNRHQSNEACDDANSVGGDYCAGNCMSITGACGDGVVQSNEPCDDGDTPSPTANGDGCSMECRVELGFGCQGEPSLCAAVCGDDITRAPEVCDDGNTDNGDYCNATCTVITGFCGDGQVFGGEECDDANDNDSDGCSALCEITVGYICGDGVTESNTCAFACGSNTLRALSDCGPAGVSHNNCCELVAIAEADTYVSSLNVNQNYGTLSPIRIQPGSNPNTGGALDNQVIFTRFDLSSITVGSEVYSAALEMTAYSGIAYGGDGNVYVQQVDDVTWGETTITWANQPASGVNLGSYNLWYNDAAETMVSLQTGTVGAPPFVANVQTRVAMTTPALRKVSYRLLSTGYRTVYRSREYTGGQGARPTLRVRYVVQ